MRWLHNTALAQQPIRTGHPPAEEVWPGLKRSPPQDDPREPAATKVFQHPKTGPSPDKPATLNELPPASMDLSGPHPAITPPADDPMRWLKTENVSVLSEDYLRHPEIALVPKLINGIRIAVCRPVFHQKEQRFSRRLELFLHAGGGRRTRSLQTFGDLLFQPTVFR